VNIYSPISHNVYSPLTLSISRRKKSFLYAKELQQAITSNLLLAVLSSPGDAVKQIKASRLLVYHQITSFNGRLF
jgi:hypothetical protein